MFNKSSCIPLYRVSLFTREWIEISPMLTGITMSRSLPLYEGVDWNMTRISVFAHRFKSPSLRGSGLKSHQTIQKKSWRNVSLFTREWIEMLSVGRRSACIWVSLFTREWIEMLISCGFIKSICRVSLFTREWIEMASAVANYPYGLGVSLFTREWIEIIRFCASVGELNVSLFTREWIEIGYPSNAVAVQDSLPRYEGADWNARWQRRKGWRKRLPLYEGVDWNLLLRNYHVLQIYPCYI